MPIGTSDGQYHDDLFSMYASQIGDKAEAMLAEQKTPPPEPDTTTDAVGVGNVPTSDVGNVPLKFGKQLLDTGGIPQKAWKEGFKTPEEEVDAANELAGIIGSGGFASVGLKPGVGMFGGRFSPTAVKAAESMEAKGYPEKVIKQLTGLERNQADDLWRKEFSDHASTYTPEKLVDIGGVKVGTLGDAVDHPELFSAYPEAANGVTVALVPKEQLRGSKGWQQESVIKLRDDLPHDEAHSILLHEIQHWIQDQHGFGQGTNREFLPHNDPALFSEMGTEFFKTDPKIKALGIAYDKAMKNNDLESASKILKDVTEEIKTKAYMAASGEVEARNVQTRAGMSPWEINQTLGKETQDIPVTQQVLIKPYKGKGTKSSMGRKPMAGPDEDALRDAGFTQYEIERVKYGKTENMDTSKLQQVNEGYAYHDGSWKKITQEDVDKVRDTVNRNIISKEQDKAEVEKILKDKNYSGLSKVLGSDWQQGITLTGSHESFVNGAEMALNRKYSYSERSLGRLERILNRNKSEGKASADEVPARIESSKTENIQVGNKEVPVLINPTASHVQGLVNKGVKEFRWFSDNSGNRYFWNAADAIHNFAAKQLGIAEKDMRSAGGVTAAQLIKSLQAHLPNLSSPR